MMIILQWKDEFTSLLRSPSIFHSTCIFTIFNSSFFTELALQRYSENVSSDNHTVIFREQQRQVCSLREGLLEAKMTRAQAVLHHGVWPECGEPGAGLLKTEFLNRPRQGKGRNQAWGPSRGPGQSGAAEDRTGNRATTDIQGPSRKQD